HPCGTRDRRCHKPTTKDAPHDRRTLKAKLSNPRHRHYLTSLTASLKRVSFDHRGGIRPAAANRLGADPKCDLGLVTALLNASAIRLGSRQRGVPGRIAREYAVPRQRASRGSSNRQSADHWSLQPPHLVHGVGGIQRTSTHDQETLLLGGCRIGGERRGQ